MGGVQRASLCLRCPCSAGGKGCERDKRDISKVCLECRFGCKDDERTNASGKKQVPVGVEDGTTWGLARDRLVENGGEILAVLERGVEGRYGHDGAGCLHPRRRPDIPRKPDTCTDVRHEQGDLTSTHRRAPRRLQS